MTYPTPDFPSNLPERDDKGRYRLTDEEYAALTPEDKLSVDMSRMMNSLSNADPEAGDRVRFREIVADLRQVDIGGDASRIPATNAIRRWENFERDRARWIDKGRNPKGFKGNGFVSSSGIDTFTNSAGNKQKLETKADVKAAIKAFSEGVLRSFDAGNGDLFTTPGQTPKDESGQPGRVARELGPQSPENGQYDQTPRDRLIDYLTAPGIWANDAGQNNKGRLYSKWKFSRNNYAVFYSSPSRASDYTVDEPLDGDWAMFA